MSLFFKFLFVDSYVNLVGGRRIKNMPSTNNFIDLSLRNTSTMYMAMTLA